jgi:hypothetical protein
MTPFLVRYVMCWSLFCIGAAVLATRLSLEPLENLRFLLVPWKVAVFVPAIVFVTFAGRYTDDETWDVVTGFGMSALTVLTSAWAVGTTWKVFTGERPWYSLFVVVAVALFASSWFYDGWLLLRDGAYTHRWLGNLMLSPIIYVCAGLLLNVERHGLAFTRTDWPRVADASVTPAMVAAGVPLVGVAAFVLVAFVRWSL